jgi:hypothetical protein
MPNCPSCGSARVRSGYRPAPLSLRIIGFRELLCDNCNYLYRAFSPLPPKHPRRHSATRKADVFAPGSRKETPAIEIAGRLPDSPAAEPTPNHPTIRPHGDKESRVCPICGSTETRRRRRRSWERLILVFSEKRPYHCADCDGSFFISTHRRD